MILKGASVQSSSILNFVPLRKRDIHLSSYISHYTIFEEALCENFGSLRVIVFYTKMNLNAERHRVTVHTDLQQ